MLFRSTGGPIGHALAIGFSQAGRYLRHHLSEGFNRDEQGRRVFDGIYSHIAGIGRIFFNMPFAQPARTGTQHEDHDFPENWFPFSTAPVDDPLTGRSGSLLRGDGSDPLLIETNTSTEYWQKGASLLHTDPLGTRDVAPPTGTRVYLIPGTQHGGKANMPRDAGACVAPRNWHDPMGAVRALLVALDEWVVSGREPPPNNIPTIAEGTLVSASAVAFPSLPGLSPPATANDVYPPGDWTDPSEPTARYGALVPQVGSDGNEIAGIRLPDVAVPTGMFAGWNRYREPHPAGELADREGTFLAFDAPPTDRSDAVRAVAADLVAQRLLLAEDAAAYNPA